MSEQELQDRLVNALHELRDRDNGRSHETWNDGQWTIRKHFGATDREAHDWFRQQLENHYPDIATANITAGQINRAASKWTSVGRQLEMSEAEKEQEKTNLKETGHRGGTQAIQSVLDKTQIAMMSEELKEYENTPDWKARSKEYRNLKEWTCELCGAKTNGLVAHHLIYDNIGSGNEPDEDLIAVCDFPCHQLADIARYFRVGRITQEQIERVTLPLLRNLR